MNKVTQSLVKKWWEGLKNVLVHNKETNTTEIGGNLEVDGNVILNGAENLVDKDGNPISGGGGSLYIHHVKMKDIRVSARSIEITFLSTYSKTFENINDMVTSLFGTHYVDKNYHFVCNGAMSFVAQAPPVYYSITDVFVGYAGPPTPVIYIYSTSHPGGISMSASESNWYIDSNEVFKL